MASATNAMNALAQVEADVAAFISAVESRIGEMRIDIAQLQEALASGSDVQPLFDEMERRLQQISSLTHSARGRL